MSRRGDLALLLVSDGRDECAVRCRLTRADTGERVSVQPGDSAWWQCGQVYWTPRGTRAVGRRLIDGKCAYDIPLPKIGYSH